MKHCNCKGSEVFYGEFSGIPEEPSPAWRSRQHPKVPQIIAEAAHHFASAALAHFRYCPATSISLSVVAPNESSLSGVKSGQLATTSGLGFASGDGGIDALQAVSIMATVTINRFLMDFFLQCLANRGLLDLDLGNGFRCAALGVVAYLSGKLQHFGLIGTGNRPAICSAFDVCAAHCQQKRQRPDEPNLRAKH
jgi:hypothetical protein